MKNKLADLNDHLFAQLERLNDEEINEEQLKKEVARSKAMTEISKEIIQGAQLRLDAVKLRADYNGYEKEQIPNLLE